MTLVVVEEKQEILLKFGNRGRELLIAKVLFQDAFASLCGPDRTYITGIELGVYNLSFADISLMSHMNKLRRP